MTTEPHTYFFSQKCKYFWLAIYAAMLTIKSPEPYVLRQPPPPPPVLLNIHTRYVQNSEFKIQSGQRSVRETGVHGFVYAFEIFPFLTKTL